MIEVRGVVALLNSHSHMMQIVNHSIPPHGPYTPSLPHHYSQHRSYPAHPTPTFHPSSHSRAHSQPQSIQDVRSRWMALQIQAMTWPPGMIEPLDSSGESPLMGFVDRSEGKYHCRVPVGDGCCDKENIKKDRMLAHIRKEHLHFRPLACGGQCGNIGWLVVSSPVRQSDVD